MISSNSTFLEPRIANAINHNNNNNERMNVRLAFEMSIHTICKFTWSAIVCVQLTNRMDTNELDAVKLLLHAKINFNIYLFSFDLLGRYLLQIN